MRRLFFLFYRAVLSPILKMMSGPGSGCRFHPTCSRYSEDAFRRFGFFRGLRLTIWRFLRCYPFGSLAYDPLPAKHSGQKEFQQC